MQWGKALGKTNMANNYVAQSTTKFIVNKLHLDDLGLCRSYMAVFDTVELWYKYLTSIWTLLTCML